MTNTLDANQSLGPNQWIQSTNGSFKLIMQSDGNLVVYRVYTGGQRPIWANDKNGLGGNRCIMQSDGNLVVYKPNAQPVWASNTVGGVSRLVMQDDGNLVIYRMNGTATWDTDPDFEARVVDRLSKVGGCAGGIAIYYAAQATCFLANAIGHKEHSLWKDTRRVFKTYFPNLDLTKIRFRNNCRLPGNWFQRDGWVEGMTFGNDMYFKGKDHQKSKEGLKRLMHELVHADQVRRLGGEKNFACEYGKGYLKAGNYYDNPLELEADLMVAKHGDSLPNGCKPD